MPDETYNTAPCPECGNESAKAIGGWSDIYECVCGHVFIPKERFEELMREVQ